MLQCKSPDGVRGPRPPPSSGSPRELGYQALTSDKQPGHSQGWASGRTGLAEERVGVPGPGSRIIPGLDSLEKGWGFEMVSAGFKTLR